ncbi:MAG TPA: DEAD/DEAH box helicase, partial [candidate division Zixibacteria bacterium]|nr:DEAD/DEAH box helicase [candidate division Zixibacteria bacterium]
MSVLRLEELAPYGIPRRLIELWRERQGETLLPVQSRAVRRGLLGAPGERAEEAAPLRMLISAPTAAGKSFCAEMAVARTLAGRRKALVLVPLRSLADQKHRLLAGTFGALGLRCLIASGDYPENDRAFAESDYDVAVAIFEKFDGLLGTRLEVLRAIGLLVVDEIQTVSEPGRGAVLERLLTCVRASAYRPGLLGLSAVIGEGEKAAGRLAEWLEAGLVVESSRPVDLLRGVAAEGAFRYRSFNSGREASEPFVLAREPGGDLFESLIERLREEPGSTIVFLKSRRETVEAAMRLAGAVGWPAAEQGTAELAEEEPSALNRILRRVMARGVAFHNADLSPRQRRAVEESFARREVRVIFATTTLAMGVDLPADTVYLETVKYTGGRRDARPALVPVSRAEFDNMAGRAGRAARAEVRPGRAVALAQSEFEGDILWENYIASGEYTSVRSAFDSMPLADWALHVLATGLAADAAGLAAVYRRSLRAVTEPEAPPPDFEAVLDLLTREGVAGREPDGLVRPTPDGETAVQTGLTCAQAVHYTRRLRESRPAEEFGWLALALSGPDWELPAGLLSRQELADNGPLRRLYRRCDHWLASARVLIGQPGGRGLTEYRTAGALKAALLLEQWRRMTPVRELEEEFRVHAGQIMAIGDTAAHLLSGIAGLLDNLDGGGDKLRPLVFSVRFGVVPELQGLHAAFRDILARSDFAALAQAGIVRVPDLIGHDPTDLGEIVKQERKLQKLLARIMEWKKEVSMRQSEVLSRVAPYPVRGSGPRPASVEIDGSCERERYLVRVDGRPVWLTGKSFKYFTRLAWSRVQRDGGWMYKEDIE